MSKNSIDKLFKDRLSKYEEPYPQHLWEGVYSGINGEVSRKRRGALWYRWMLLGVLLLMAGGSGWYLWQSGQSNEGSEPVQEEQTLSMDSSQAMISESGQSTQSVQGQKITGYEADAIGSRSDSGTNDVSESEKASLELTASRASSRELAIQDQKGSVVYTDKVNKSDVMQDDHATSGSKTTQFANEEDEVREAVYNNSDIYNSDTRRSQMASATSLTGYENFRLAGKDEGDGTTRLMREVLPELNSYRKTRFVGHFGVAVVYGQDIVQRDLTAKTESDLALLNQRASSESFVNAFMTGFEVNMKVRKWTLYSGLHYTQINERVNYTLRGTERTVDGNPIIGDLKRSVVNRYQMLSVPVYLGYEVSRGPWALEAQAGINIGLSLATSGEVFDREGLSYLEYDNTSENNPYRDQPGMSWHGAIMLSYKTGYGQRLFLRPNIRWYNSSFTKEGYGLDQEYQSYGITAGYRVRL